MLTNAKEPKIDPEDIKDIKKYMVIFNTSADIDHITARVTKHKDRIMELHDAFRDLSPQQKKDIIADVAQSIDPADQFKRRLIGEKDTDLGTAKPKYGAETRYCTLEKYARELVFGPFKTTTTPTEDPSLTLTPTKDPLLEVKTPTRKPLVMADDDALTPTPTEDPLKEGNTPTKAPLTLSFKSKQTEDASLLDKTPCRVEVEPTKEEVHRRAVLAAAIRGGY